MTIFSCVCDRYSFPNSSGDEDYDDVFIIDPFDRLFQPKYSSTAQADKLNFMKDENISIVDDKKNVKLDHNGNEIFRNTEQTLKLFDKLIVTFPRNAKEIDEILYQYPTYINSDYLIDKLLVRLSRFN